MFFTPLARGSVISGMRHTMVVSKRPDVDVFSGPAHGIGTPVVTISLFAVEMIFL